MGAECPEAKVFRMRTELISIETDNEPMDGALYLPDEAPARGGILLFHGNVSNFYTGIMRALPSALTELKFACLAFNRRSHDILATGSSRIPVGGAFQTVARDIADNRTAAAWFAERGFSKPVIIGHSNGGMLAAQHVADHPDTPALVLLSAHRGGNIEHQMANGKAGNGMYAEDQHAAIRRRAEALVSQGRGREIMLMPGWWYVVSAQAYLDRMTNMPDLIVNAARITCPSLFVRGDQEVADIYPAEEFQAATKGTCDIEIVEDCNHYYQGRFDQVSDLVSRWLSKSIGS